MKADFSGSIPVLKRKFIMRSNNFSVLALIALAAASSGAFAQDLAYGQAAGSAATPFVSTRTRAEVQQEAAQALAQGQLGFGIGAGPDQSSFVSTRTRAEVQAEVRQALRNGEILNGLGAGSHVAQSQSVNTASGNSGASSSAM